MQIWVSSIISGSLGVLIGSIIQVIYMYIAERKHLKDDYKKICVAEWIAFINQSRELINNPKNYNHIIFNQYIDQKIGLLKYIKKNKDVKDLQTFIEEKKDALSLSDYAERALNTKSNYGEKEKLMVEVSTLVKDTILRISEI